MVVKAFVHGGTIRMPKTSITLADADAKPLLEAGKVILAKSDDPDDAKGAVKAGKKAAAKDDDDKTAKG
jgi:hypothetical protein